MQEESLIIEYGYDAPVEKVWEALTDRDKMKEWYFDLDAFEARVGFRFQFYGENDGEKFLHQCVVTAVVPEKLLSYSWRYADYPGDSELSFELFPENGKTRLKLTHKGLETFPAGPDFARTNFVEGWTYLTGKSLRDFVEK
jgi:uncharacterized protein YndB with AHSA1/START domain